MVIEPPGTPVILKHTKVEVITAHYGQLADSSGVSSKSTLYLLALQQLGLGPVIVRHRGHTRGDGQAFLRSADHGIQHPGICLYRHPADRRHRVHNQQRILLPAGPPDPVQRLHTACRGLTVNHRHHIRLEAPYSLNYLLRRKDTAPSLFYREYLSPAAFSNLMEQMTETAKDRNQHPVPGAIRLTITASIPEREVPSTGYAH